MAFIFYPNLYYVNLENFKSNQGMKFDAHVFNVGFILYLVAQVIPEPQRANQSFVPRFLYLHTPQLPLNYAEGQAS